MESTRGWQKGATTSKMGAGRKPQPAKLLDNDTYKISNDKLEQRIKVEEALKTKSTLKTPSYLSDVAKKEWRRIMKLYKQMDIEILNDLDSTALVMYCEATAIYRKAQETWKKVDQVVSGNSEGQRVLDKTFIVMERQTKIINSLAEQLCLTPVGRARMGAATANSNNENAVLKLFKEED